MSAEGRVVRNSVWLVAQPLVLNAVSIFAMGYITRKLGAADYGRFTLAFVFVAMFAPFSNMGLRAVTVRDIAAEKSTTDLHLAKMLGTRALLSFMAVAVMVATTSALGYDSLTIQLTFIAAMTLVAQALSSTIQDAFQAHERMSHVAYSQFVGGTVLTICSCLVLFAGFGVSALTLTYVLGAVVTLAVALVLVRPIARIRFDFDFGYAVQKLRQAAPFFVPNLIASVGGKVGAVLLSKFATEAAVGYFGAAYSLTDRLVVIVDGICTAIYPTLTVLYATSREEAGKLFQKFYEYLLILALPIGVGTTILARPIIRLVCGEAFEGAAPVLVVLVWGLAASFVTSIQVWALAAMRHERIAARVGIISTIVCVVGNVVFIPLWAEVGTALASLVSTLVSFALVQRPLKQLLVPQLIHWNRLARVCLACAVMGGVVYLLREVPVVFAIGAGAVVYGVALVLFGTISREELNLGIAKVLRRRG